MIEPQIGNRAQAVIMMKVDRFVFQLGGSIVIKSLMALATLVCAKQPAEATRSGRWLTHVYCLFILAFASGASGDEQKSTEIKVVLPKNFIVPQAHVLIYRDPDDENDWPVIQADVACETDYEVKISLPDGRYVAEYGAVAESVLTLLRSSPFNVPATRRVTLQAEKHLCGATISSKSARVQQVALRRIGNGEVRWSAETSPPPVVIFTSPNQPYVASCVAQLGHKYLAVWTPKEAIKTSKLNFTDTIARHQLKFTLRDGTPALSSSQVTLHFPDANFNIDDPTHAVFMTNRDRVYCDYQLETKAKEKLCFTAGACLIEDQSKFEMGGPLSSKCFAGFIWSENGGGWDPGGLYTRVELVDADGRMLDGNRSQPNHRIEMFFAPDKQDPVPLEGQKPGASGFKSDSVLAKVYYSYGGRIITSESRGEDLVRVYSEHFSIGTPSMWMFKARQYLSCLESIRLLTIKNTGRPGPASFKVDWRINGNDAKSIVGSLDGGGQDIWMSFPWWTFDSFWDPFTEPWFGNHDPYVCHEMLHAFGYHHGDEMSKFEWRAEDQYRTLRWRSVDSGEWQVWQIPLRGEKN